MINTKTISAPVVEISLQDRASTVLTFVYQIVALVIFAVVPLLAFNWFRTPFVGTLIEHTMIVNALGPRVADTWSAYGQGLDEFGQQLVAVNGEQVHSSKELQQKIKRYNVGDTITMTYIDNNGGEQKTINVTLQQFPSLDKLSLFFTPYIIGLFYLTSSLWVYSLRRHDIAGRAFVLFSTSVAISLATLFDLYTTHRLTYIWSTALALGGGGMFIIALVFPEKVNLVRKYPILRWLPVVPAVLLALNTYPTLFNTSDPTAYALAWRYEYFFNGLAAFSLFGWTTVRFFTTRSPITREQARIILWGSAIAFAPLGTWMIASSLFSQFLFHPVILLPMVAFPVAITYTILRYRLLVTDYILSRATLYAILSTLTVATYVLLVWGGNMLFGSAVSPNNPFLVGAMIFILTVAFNPIRLRLQKTIDSLFFRGQTVYQERLQGFGRELTQTVELPKIIGLLHRFVNQNLKPIQSHIFLHNPLSDQYIAASGEEDKPATDIRFSVNSALVQTLKNERTPVFLGDTGRLPSHLMPDRARLALLGAQLFVALPGQQQLTGWLALGPRNSGEPYRRGDITFIEALSDQAALAIERAQVIFDLERRVHEMNVLARVAQGVNVTINFDDILELIYAQTVQVLSTQYFRITLYDDVTHTFYHVFYLENDDRVSKHENRPIPDGLGLEQEIVRSQRAIITEDYVRECRHRSYIPAMQGIYAWIGVPLNTGNETIGAISLGSTDPSVTYTREQQSILQAIADQAAGAIIKTQLFQETERRAQQLAMLNRVGRSLTSTLDIDILLNQILESAVEILNCEAGSLLMVDEETDELVFQVTVGPVAGDLTGMRLPPGTGMVGKAVDTRQPVINNSVQQSKDWFEKTDQETGFATRALLVVPMQIRDDVIGVIEVINKADRSPFTPDDQRLLTAFTAQAAVAIQNARLFTMTDQALAARVEELSVMQRIDRELNASLDLSRAMHITLDWAMRQSEAGAGLVAIIDQEDENVRVMASQGYDLDFDDQQNAAILTTLPPIQEAIYRQSSQQALSTQSENGFEYLHPDAQNQIVIPIRREQQTIGVVFLESEQPEIFTDETLAFLTRLSDHAAIAISNAQLYTAVEAANIAKSDFVSFVSHELKTPMTSIRGYTDLLAAGAVGVVNDAQSGFLSTIRSNVDRMATLVTDLADISRIEAGRLRLDFGAVSIKGIIDEVVRSARGQIDEKKQTLALNVPDDLPMVWGDRIRLVQVLTNLISNAHKYTPNEGAITIRAENIENQEDIPTGAIPEVIRITVKDSGIGIEPEDQKRIFSKFFRSDDPKARESPGTGLGLNITKNLVELQGGCVWFESEFRKGTAFHFTIPVAETG